MITHHSVRTVLAGLDIDPDKLAFLHRYVDAQGTLDETADPVRRANSAERRSDTALALAATLRDEVADLRASLPALRDLILQEVALILADMGGCSCHEHPPR